MAEMRHFWSATCQRSCAIGGNGFLPVVMGAWLSQRVYPTVTVGSRWGVRSRNCKTVRNY